MPRRTGFNPEPTAPSHLWPCIFAALLLAALGLPAICTAKDRTIDHPPVSAAVDFALTDHNGELFELRRLRGRIVLIFFGYTACPDVCPNELTNLASVLRALGERCLSA